MKFAGVSTVLIGCCMSAATAIAAGVDDVKTLAGVRLSQASASFSGMAGDSGSGVGVVLGVSYDDFRVHADLTLFSMDEADIRTIVASYERLWPVNAQMSLFAGVNGGVVDFEPDQAIYGTKGFQSGVTLGLQGGLIYQLSPRWQLEAGVRHNRFRAEMFSPTLNRDLRLDSQTEAFLILNFSS